MLVVVQVDVRRQTWRTHKHPQDKMFPMTCSLTPDEHLQACDHDRLYIPKKETETKWGWEGAEWWSHTEKIRKKQPRYNKTQMMTFVGNILSHYVLQCHVLQAKFNSSHVALKLYPEECTMYQSLMLNHVFQTPAPIVLWVGSIFTFALSSMKMVEQGQC